MQGELHENRSYRFSYLLGLLFTVFGLNGFLHFIPQPPPANPVAIQFLTAMSASHYMSVVFLIQLVGGVLLLTGFYVPLAIAILAPVRERPELHITMDPGGIGPGAFASILWIVLLLRYRSSFRGLLRAGTVEAQPAKI